jgi:hypothetical protein
MTGPSPVFQSLVFGGNERMSAVIGWTVLLNALYPLEFRASSILRRAARWKGRSKDTKMVHAAEPFQNIVSPRLGYHAPTNILQIDSTPEFPEGANKQAG